MKTLRLFLYHSCLIIIFFMFPQPVSADDIYEMEPVVVTAQKTEEDLQQVPISISVIDEEAIDDTGSIKLLDLVDYVPNLGSTEHVSMHRRITIRGVGGYSRNIGFDTRVGVFLDGVYLGQSQALNFDLVDVERVEVLRGPQGVFWGKNTVAGAINIVSKKPDEMFGGKAYVELGNENHRRAQFQLNTPLIKEKLFSSFSYSHFEQDGFYTNLYTGEELDNQDSQAFRGQFDALISDQADFSLKIDGSSSERKTLIGYPLTDTFAVTTDTVAPGKYDVSFNTTPYENTDLFGINGTLNYDFDSDFQLTSITAFRRSEWFFRTDLDYSPLDLFSVEFTDEYRQLSQEIRLNSPPDIPVKYFGGIYFSRQYGETDRAAILGSMIPALGDSALLPGNKVRNSGEVVTDSCAVFMNGSYQFSTKSNVFASFRYTYEIWEPDFYLDGSQSGIFNIAVLDYDDKTSDSTFSPNIGVSHSFNNNVTGYAKITTGHKSGGANLDFLSNYDVATGITYDKETVINYELGLKSNLFDKGLEANLSAFYAEYDDYQVNQFIDLGGGATSISIKNAAEVITQGAELEIFWNPTREWRIVTGFSLLDAYFESFPGGGTAGADATGNDLPFAPHFTSNINVQYAIFDIISGARLTLHGNYTYVSKQYTTPANVETQPLFGGGTVPYGVLDSYHLLSANIDLESNNDTWRIRLWIKNITDEEYLVDSLRDFMGTVTATSGQPRTYGIGFQYKF